MKTINKNYINGKFVKTSSKKFIILKNPTNEENIAKLYLGTKNDIKNALFAAKETLATFSKTSLKERKEILQNIYNELIKKENELNKIATIEYGAPINTTKRRTKNAINLFLEMQKIIDEYEYEKRDEFSLTLREGVGVIGVIIPWNATYAHLCGNIAPAIAMGCTLVIKPSEFNALETELFLECLDRANIPKGVINVVNGTGETIGEMLTKSEEIDAISFIGSSNTGKKIYKNASKTIKRIVLELGGKSPSIILEDVSLEEVIPKVIDVAFSNSGQACHAGSRLIVPKSKLQEVEKLLVENIKKLKIGDPSDESVKIGPMINEKQYKNVQTYIQSGIDEGAKLLCGGAEKMEGFDRGYFVKPTIFVCEHQNYKIVKEEIFGPVLSVLSYESEDEAVEIANNTEFGLSAYIFTNDDKKALHFAKNIKSGRVLINRASSPAPYPPFGGMKQSGIGRMGGKYSLDEFSEIKSILF
ncbi:MAG: aldehyde dehydrogenase family protein [Campylobacteraceae bacterium]|jgi:aldehyde dehydrogenase (NAD+)|nr:aldehyde dehydrogenase family protein [Campylobacteraceae bacterium]